MAVQPVRQAAQELPGVHADTLIPCLQELGLAIRSDFQTDLEILRSNPVRSRLEIIQGKTSGQGRMFGPEGGLGDLPLHPAACGLHRHRIGRCRDGGRLGHCG